MARAVAAPEAPARSDADRWMRRLLRIPEDAPPGSLVGAQNAFGRSILISAVRCLLTYIVIPLVGLVVDVSGTVGPILGLALSAVSMVAIVLAMRRLFAADHRLRWWYAAIGGAVFVLLLAGAAVDTVELTS